MRVVIDVGCQSYGEWTGPAPESLMSLAEERQPDSMIGIDPNIVSAELNVDGVPTTLRGEAAWICNGVIGFLPAGISSRVHPGGETMVPCFDFNAYLDSRFDGKDEVIVKLDVEGAEYPLLNRMIDDGSDSLISELIVEWHPQYQNSWPMLDANRLRCPVTEWWM